MSRRTKIYTAFDADSDIHYYRLMQAWAENGRFDFDFNNAHDMTSIWEHSSEETIKRHLRERMANSNVFVLLVGEKTHTLRKYVPYEINLALEAKIPIIVVNLNKKRTHDQKLCPTSLDNALAIHIGYHTKILKYALDNWPSSYATHRANGVTGVRIYNEQVYKDLGIENSTTGLYANY